MHSSTHSPLSDTNQQAALQLALHANRWRPAAAGSGTNRPAAVEHAGLTSPAAAFTSGVKLNSEACAPAARRRPTTSGAALLPLSSARSSRSMQWPSSARASSALALACTGAGGQGERHGNWQESQTGWQLVAAPRGMDATAWETEGRRLISASHISRPPTLQLPLAASKEICSASGSMFMAGRSGKKAPAEQEAAAR